MRNFCLALTSCILLQLHCFYVVSKTIKLGGRLYLRFGTKCSARTLVKWLVTIDLVGQDNINNNIT